MGLAFRFRGENENYRILSQGEVKALLEAPRTLRYRALLAVLYGRSVVRRHGSAVAISVMAYQFRTMARRQCRSPGVCSTPDSL